MIVPIQQLVQIPKVLDESLIEVEDENRGSWSIICNNCGKTAWMCKWIRNKKTRRCALLQEKYFPETGQVAKRHYCMQQGTKDGKWINKYDDKDNFYRDNVVKDKDNNIMKQAKIDRYNKLTGYGYVENSKQKDLSYVKEWESYSF